MRPEAALFPALSDYLAEVRHELHAISEGRKRALDQLARFLHDRRGCGEAARLTFICTHNSRRSHLAQVWAQTAAHLFGLTGVETYSGGTEATAFNPRAVAALERAGFRVRPRDQGPNPVYLVRFAAGVKPMECFSKVYHQPPNPTTDFCAVMTCSSADAGCPLVLGASARVVIPYEDPKDADGTDRESAAYDERCRQIAREMLFALTTKRVANCGPGS